MENNKQLINYDSSDDEQVEKREYVYVEMDGKIINRIEVPKLKEDSQDGIFSSILDFLSIL